jgi:hypothetical protein
VLGGRDFQHYFYGLPGANGNLHPGKWFDFHGWHDHRQLHGVERLWA